MGVEVNDCSLAVVTSGVCVSGAIVTTMLCEYM